MPSALSLPILAASSSADNSKVGKARAGSSRARRQGDGCLMEWYSVVVVWGRLREAPGDCVPDGIVIRCWAASVTSFGLRAVPERPQHGPPRASRTMPDTRRADTEVGPYMKNHARAPQTRPQHVPVEGPFGDAVWHVGLDLPYNEHNSYTRSGLKGCLARVCRVY